MRQLYTSYSSITNTNNQEIQENLYESWDKKKNKRGKSKSRYN